MPGGTLVNKWAFFIQELPLKEGTGKHCTALYQQKTNNILSTVNFYDNSALQVHKFLISTKQVFCENFQSLTVQTKQL